MNAKRGSMMNENIEVIKLSNNLLECLLLLNDWKSKDEIENMAEQLKLSALGNEEFDSVIKDAHILMAKTVLLMKFEELVDVRKKLLK